MEVTVGTAALALALLLLPLLYERCGSFRFFCKMGFYNGWILLLALLAIPLCALRGRDVENMKIIRGLMLHVKRLYGIRMEVRGAHNFPPRQPYVVVSNHQSSLDLMGMMEVLPDRCVPIAKRELLYMGAVGVVCWLGGIIFIDRKRTHDAISVMAEAAHTMLSQDVRVWVFPEGTRNHSGSMLPFKRGAFHLAVQAQVPVVPIVISSYQHFYSKRERRFTAGQCLIQVLPPLPTRGLGPADVPALTDSVRAAMLDAFEGLTAELSDQSDQSDHTDHTDHTDHRSDHTDHQSEHSDHSDRQSDHSDQQHRTDTQSDHQSDSQSVRAAMLDAFEGLTAELSDQSDQSDRTDHRSDQSDHSDHQSDSQSVRAAMLDAFEGLTAELSDHRSDQSDRSDHSDHQSDHTDHRSDHQSDQRSDPMDTASDRQSDPQSVRAAMLDTFEGLTAELSDQSDHQSDRQSDHTDHWSDQSDPQSDQAATPDAFEALLAELRPTAGQSDHQSDQQHPTDGRSDQSDPWSDHSDPRSDQSDPRSDPRSPTAALSDPTDAWSDPQRPAVTQSDPRSDPTATLSDPLSDPRRPTATLSDPRSDPTEAWSDQWSPTVTPQ